MSRDRGRHEEERWERERERESELETHSDTVDKRDSLSRFTQSCVFGV